MEGILAFGTATQVLSTTAAALASHPCGTVVVHNNDAAIAILLGNSATQSYTIAPGGDSGNIEVRNTNQVFVKSASGTPTCSYHWE